MSDIALPDGRPLKEPERQAFKQLGLTPGHLAALVAAPFFSRAGVRTPDLREAEDVGALDELRLVVRAAKGYGDEAFAYWRRLGTGERGLAPLGTRLLAWHLATDFEFDRREYFLAAFRAAAARFALPPARPAGAWNARPEPPLVALRELRRLIDAYFPYPTFRADVDPVWTRVAPPDAGTLARLAAEITTIAGPWPTIHPAQVAARMRALVDVFGHPPGDWWERPDAARRAIERGLAARNSPAREVLYEQIRREWLREIEVSFLWPNSPQFAELFVQRLREWADAARKAARAANASAPYNGSAADVAAPIVVSPPAPPPVPADSVRVPAALREFVPPPPAPKPPPKPMIERVTATVAEPFSTLPFERALARACATSVADVCRWADAPPRLLFDDCRDDASREVAVVMTGSAVPPALWVIGDLHADLLTLANAVAHAEAVAAPDEPPHFLFLGDFVDRGVHDHETLLFLFGLMIEHPERVRVVPGNHDIDLQFNENANRFRVTIEPAEYCERLNAAIERNDPDGRERVELARAFVRFCAGRPKAVFLPDGTLLAHGGFPHTDAQKDVAALPDLCRPRCVDDFLWARIAESARVKRPNRGSRGHEFGWDTFAQFCRLAGERLDVPVRRLVRGHDHVPDRWQEYPEYADNLVPVLTVNAMGRALDGDAPRRDGRPHPLPALARYVPNHLPDVVLLPLDPVEVDRAFASPPAGDAP